MTPAEQAAKMWPHLERAARELVHGAPPGSFPRVHVGSNLSEELVRELGRVSGGIIRAYRYQSEGSVEMVFVAFTRVVAGVEIEGFHSRPSAEADAEIPLRGGRS